MAKGQMITVKILGWEKHNGKKKKGHQYFMFSTRFFDDEKLRLLSTGDKLTYIWLLCRCGDSLKSTLSFPEVALKSAISNLKVPLKCLQRLEKFQLLTIEKIESFSTRHDKTLHDKTRQEENIRPSEKQGELLPAEPAPTKHPLFLIWNEHRGKLPEAKTCSGPRLKKVKLRWSEQTPTEWMETVKRMAISDFCNGKNSNGWRADFEFLLKADTWAKVNEGKYDNGTRTSTTRATQIYDNLERLEEKWAKK